jgi:hypothetical protein
LNVRRILLAALAAGFVYSGMATVSLGADVLRAPEVKITTTSAMTALWIAIAIGLLATCGHAVVALVARETRLYWHERWAAAWLLGCGTCTFAWFVLMPLYGWISPIWLLTAFISAVSVIGGTRRWTMAPPSRCALRRASDGRWTIIDNALVVLLLAQVVMLFIAAWQTPLGWDGLFNFETKARLAFEHTPTGQLPLAYFSDPSQKASHPQYPLLVPFTEFWLYTWLGRVDRSVIKVLFPIFYLSLIGFVVGAVRRVADRRSGMLAAIALGLLPPLTLIPGAASGYADVPLAAAVAGAISFALIGIGEGKADAAALGSALLGVAVWTKSEGLLFAVAIALSTLALKRGRVVLWWAPILTAVPWVVFQQIFGQGGGDFHPVTGALLVGNVDRVPTIALLVARELVRPGHWALIFPVFLYLLAVMVMRRWNATDGFLAAIVVVPLTAYGLMYIFSAWPDMREHIGTSLSRVMVPLAPLTLMFIVRQLQADSSFEAREWA